MSELDQTEPDQIVRDLQATLDQDPHLAEVLEKSLRMAGERAEADLNPELRDALDWPQDLPAYHEYLRSFIRWIPQQTDAPAWKVTAPHERYAKEVSDRLATSSGWSTRRWTPMRPRSRRIPRSFAVG